jgi:cytoskeletal protein RodZ
MSCNHFEKLIPLYVEGDLEADDLHDVAEHVRGCHSCARLANHYTASQAWLHTLTEPEFDEAFYADLKQSVMQEIHSRKARPSFFQWFVWQWKPAYAVAFLLLMLFGAIAIYVQTNRQSATPNNNISAKQVEEKQQPEKKDPTEEQQAPQPELQKSETGVLQQAQIHQPHSIRRHRDNEPSVKPPPMNLEPIIDSQVSLKNRDEIVAEEMSEMGTFISSEAMTRIEIQTSDPNIRIIWFAPKTIELPKTMTE